jgi:hypothetical protein
MRAVRIVSLVMAVALIVSCGSSFGLAPKDDPPKNSMTIKTFRETKPKDPVTLRLVAELSNYYAFDFRDSKETHWSVQMKEQNGHEIVIGYILKNSPDGKAIYQLLKDGKTHPVIIQLKCPGKRGDIAEITKLVSIPSQPAFSNVPRRDRIP